MLEQGNSFHVDRHGWNDCSKQEPHGLVWNKSDRLGKKYHQEVWPGGGGRGGLPRPLSQPWLERLELLPRPQPHCGEPPVAKFIEGKIGSGTVELWCSKRCSWMSKWEYRSSMDMGLDFVEREATMESKSVPRPAKRKECCSKSFKGYPTAERLSERYLNFWK